MYGTMLRALSAAGLMGLLLLTPALAEPEPGAETETPAEEEDPDEVLIKSLLGKTYSGDLPIEGWTDFGGGLVRPPIYVHLYQREDGSALVLTSKLSSKTHEVTDALIISKPWKGYAISIACTQGEDFTLRFIGDARGPEANEWWTEVRRAWEIALEPEPAPESEDETEAETVAETAAKGEPEPQPEPGTITKANTKGVKCANPNW